MAFGHFLILALLPGRLDAEPLTSSTLRTALTDWCNDPTAAEATHGHISTWDTSGATDMSHLFSRYDSNWNDVGGAYCSTYDTFDADISGWDGKFGMGEERALL